MGEGSLCCVPWLHLPLYALGESVVPPSNFGKIYRCRVSGTQHDTVVRAKAPTLAFLVKPSMVSLEASQLSFELLNEIYKNILFAKTQTIQTD